MKRLLLSFFYIALLTLSALSLASYAETRTGGDFTIHFDAAGAPGGGEASIGGGYELRGAAAQPASGGPAAGDPYSVSAGYLSAIDTSVPTVVIVSPSSGANLQGTVTINGTASHETGSSWVLYYGPGASPPAWKQIASGAANATASDLATWDASMLAGDYTLKLESASARGFSTETTTKVSVSGTTSVSGTAAAGQWTMLGVPGTAADTEPTSIFGLLQKYKLYRWDPEAEDDDYLAKYCYPHSLEPGFGYWIKSFDADISYSYEASISDTTEDFVLDVKKGWNQVAAPFPVDFPWTELTIVSGSETYNLSDAVSGGIISSVFYSYDPAGASWVLHESGESLKSGTGYFVRLYEDSQLLFAPGAGTAEGIAKIVRNDVAFKVKISAGYGGTADTDNYFGLARTADDDYDPRDAEEPPLTPGGEYVSLYFPHLDWDENPGLYALDMKDAETAGGAVRTWNFEVSAPEESGPVSITWNPGELPSERYLFTLADTETGLSLDMSETGEYIFEMSSGESPSCRSFNIDVEAILSGLTTLAITLEPGWNLVSVPLEPEVTSVISQLGDDLANLNVFQLFDGKFYPTGNTDIQAGVGFWIFSPEEAEIDVVGFPVGSEMRIPLAIGWNIIGNPFDTSLMWDDGIVMTCGDVEYRLSEAVAAGITDGKIYSYADGGYEDKDILAPWRGYFVKSESACSIKLSQ